MFGMRKSREPSRKKEPDEGTAETEDVLVSQPTGPEEMDNEQASDSEKIQIKDPRPNIQPGQLINAVEGSEEDEVQVEDLFEQPNKPEGELSVQVEKVPPVEDKDLIALLGKEDEEKEKQENEGDDMSFSSLFGEEEAEENPLMGLINSFPDVTAQELLEEAKEVKTMAHEWQQA